MSAFKDAVALDIDRTFLNLNEFGELHEIGGVVDVPCVLDKILTGPNTFDALIGTFLNHLAIYVEVGAIPTPVEGQPLSVDGSIHFVKSVSREDGILFIVAEANDQ